MVVRRWSFGDDRHITHQANDSRLTTNDYLRYFPNIKCSFSFVADGILAVSVRIAFASADPHLQERVFGIAATEAFTTFAAFSAFFTSTETICSTVTES